MNNYDKIKLILFNAVDEVNQQLLPEQKMELTLDTVLVGNQSKIDSLALVNLIVAAEERIGDEFGVSLTLVNEKALSQDESPFRTIGSFIDYISLLLKEQAVD